MTLSLDERRIAEIVQRVVADLRPPASDADGPAQGSRPPAPAPPQPRTGPAPAAAGDQEGVFADIDAAIAAAEAAQRQLVDLPLERRAALIAAMRQAATESAQVLAHAAWQETGMGRQEDKLKKNLLVAERTPGTEALQAQAWTGDRGLTLVERAPYGVIGAITPSTNPTSTIICNAIGMIAAGNAVVFNAHPAATGHPARRRAGEPDHLPRRADHRERSVSHAPSHHRPAGRHRRSRCGAGGHGLGQKGHLRRSRQPAGSRG